MRPARRYRALSARGRAARAQGRHEELLAEAGGPYARLVAKQVGGGGGAGGGGRESAGKGVRASPGPAE
jgi:hypothetical protein